MYIICMHINMKYLYLYTVCAHAVIRLSYTHRIPLLALALLARLACHPCRRRASRVVQINCNNKETNGPYSYSYFRVNPLAETTSHTNTRLSLPHTRTHSPPCACAGAQDTAAGTAASPSTTTTPQPPTFGRVSCVVSEHLRTERARKRFVI